MPDRRMMMPLPSLGRPACSTDLNLNPIANVTLIDSKGGYKNISQFEAADILLSLSSIASSISEAILSAEMVWLLAQKSFLDSLV